jgi:hypothetical protein
MPEPIASIDLLHQEIANPDTQWSLGTFGAIAEFSLVHDAPEQLVQTRENVSYVTPRGDEPAFPGHD